MIFRSIAILLLAIGSLSILPACSQSKKVQQRTIGTAILKPGFDVSPLTKTFLKDLQKALDSTNTTLDKFEPTTLFASKHGLAKESGAWRVAGLMKTDTAFKQQALKDVGIDAGSFSGNIVTVRVPLAALQQFLNTKGITYFEKTQVKTNQ